MKQKSLGYRGYAYRRISASNGYSAYRITKAGKPCGVELSMLECRRRIDALCDLHAELRGDVVSSDFSALELRNLP